MNLVLCKCMLHVPGYKLQLLPSENITYSISSHNSVADSVITSLYIYMKIYIEQSLHSIQPVTIVDTDSDSSNIANIQISGSDIQVQTGER